MENGDAATQLIENVDPIEMTPDGVVNPLKPGSPALANSSPVKESSVIVDEERDETYMSSGAVENVNSSTPSGEMQEGSGNDQAAQPETKESGETKTLDGAFAEIEDYELRLRKQAWTETMSKKHLAQTFNILASRLKKPKKRTVVWKREVFYRKYSKLARWIRYEETSPGAWTTLSDAERKRRNRLMERMGIEADPAYLNGSARFESERNDGENDDDNRDENLFLKENRRQSDRLRGTRYTRNMDEDDNEDELFYDENGKLENVKMVTSSAGRVVKKIDYAQFM